MNGSFIKTKNLLRAESAIILLNRPLHTVTVCQLWNVNPRRHTRMASNDNGKKPTQGHVREKPQTGSVRSRMGGCLCEHKEPQKQPTSLLSATLTNQSQTIYINLSGTTDQVFFSLVLFCVGETPPDIKWSNQWRDGMKGLLLTFPRLTLCL